MKSRFFKLLIFFLSLVEISFSQNISVKDLNSHELFVETLKNSKNIKFQEILVKYDSYIEDYPTDIEVKVFRCKFIGSAYYDEYEDYNLKYDETQICIDELYKTYPNNPDVQLYKLESLYGDEQRLLLESSLKSYELNKSNWNYNQASKLFQIGAQFFSEENDYKSLQYAEKAEKFSDSLDLSILISNIHLRLGNKEKARESIKSYLYLDSDAWDLNQKGEILIELGEYEDALVIFERVKKKDSSLLNNENLSKIFTKAKNYDIARSYILKDTIHEWDKANSLRKLVDYDLAYSNGDIALESYRRLQQENYFDDFLGIKRLKIFFKVPLKHWTFSELSHILILVLLIALIFVIPYLWVLPVYSIGKYYSIKKDRINQTLLGNDWSLKHFWKISFLYLIAQLLVVLIFYYQNYIDYFFNVVVSYYDESIIENELSTANSLLLFSFTLLVFTGLFLNKERIKFVFASSLSLGRMIFYGILFVIGNGIILKLLGNFIDINETINTITTFSINNDVVVLMNNYGFAVSLLFIAIIVPFYEEVIFRGIILSATKKHIGFIGANIIQASLFALVHFNLKLFLFYLIFGLVTGYAVKKTRGLLACMILHSINNFFVLFVIYLITRIAPAIY